MTTPAAPSEGSIQTPSASTPVSTPTPTPAPAASPFADTPAPDWVKTAGLEDVHKPVVPTTPPTAPATAPVTPLTATVPSTPPAVPQTLTVDHAALARAIREGNAPAPAGPTDEELSQQLGIVTVTPQLYKDVFGIDGTPAQITGLNNYGQAIAKQAVTIAKVLFDRELKEFRDSMAPYTQVVQQQEASRIKSEFFKTHADLAGYEELVTQQYQLAKSSGRKFNTLDEASKFIADQTRSVLKGLGITPTAPSVTNGSTPSGKSVPQTRTMTPLSTGGKSSGSPSANQPKTIIEQVWGA